MIHETPPTRELVRQLHELASTPFDLAAHRRRWEGYGWDYRPSPEDRFGFQVSVPEHGSLWIDPLGREVLGARLPFCFWETRDPDRHVDAREHRRQRNAFDLAFFNAGILAEEELEVAPKLWTDRDADAHRACIWETEHGLLILQQACFDLQSGLEIHFWLERRSADFATETPLIDGCIRRSSERHDAEGFPELPWDKAL